MSYRRVVDLSGGDGFLLLRYVWRGPPMRSSLYGEKIRGIVGLDACNRFWPGARIVNAYHPNVITVFRRSPSENIADATNEACKIAHEQITERLMRRMGGRWQKSGSSPNEN